MQPWDSLRLVVVTAQLLCAEVQRVTVCVCCSNALRSALRRRWSQKVLEGSRRFRKFYPAPLWYSLRESGWRKGGKLHEAVSPEERRRRREAASGRRCFNFPPHHPNLLKIAPSACEGAQWSPCLMELRGAQCRGRAGSPAAVPPVW